MEITKREIIASIVIISLMMIIGFFISDKISDSQNDKASKYRKAIQITDSDVFQHGMETSIGNAFVYGELKAIDAVSYPEIEGQYMYIEKVKEQYTRHSRTVTYTTGSGKNKKTHTKIEHYWTWDEVDSEEKKSKEISFCGVTFNSDKIKMPSASFLDTINESGNIRYQYYGVETQYTGTIYTTLKDSDMIDPQFYKDMKISEVLESYLSEGEGMKIVFWILWIIFIAVVVSAFYYLDNRWLE